MKIIADLEKKTLRILENERPIFRGEVGADKLILLMNKTLLNEYPSITGLLSNGRKIGPFTTDEAYGTETIDGVTYTTASFTLSKANGFTLSEGKTQITIWMNKTNGTKEALGNVTFNVINTTAFDDGDIIISGDVEGTIVNIKVELENLQNQVNTFNGRITNLEAKKFIDLGTITQAPYEIENDILNNTINFGTYTFKYSDNQYIMLISQGKSPGSRPGIMVDVIHQIIIPAMFTTQKQCIHRYKRGSSGEWTIERFDIATTDYVDKKIADLINGAPETLDTLFEIANALQDDDNAISGLITEISKKADKKDIPTKVSQLEQDVELGVSEEQVMEIIQSQKQIVLKDEDNGFTINLDAESGHIKINDGVQEAIVNPYQIMIKQGENIIDLHIENGICYSYDGAYSVLLRNGIETENEEDGYRYFYFPKKEGTLALEEQMQEMIVDIVWDENGEAVIELGNNVIDWSRTVYFHLQEIKNSIVYSGAILEWKFSQIGGGNIVDTFVYCGLGSPNDYGQIFNGCWCISGGIKSGVDRDLTSQHDPSYVIFVNVIEGVNNLNKMKVYYYPVNEYSPSVNVEI